MFSLNMVDYSTHVLPQANWIPEDLAPLEEEIVIADQELEFYTKESFSRATALLSSDILPHGDHEYQIVNYCQMCEGELKNRNMAYSCLVCSTAVCYDCRNKHMTKMENAEMCFYQNLGWTG